MTHLNNRPLPLVLAAVVMAALWIPTINSPAQAQVATPAAFASGPVLM